MDNEKFLVSLKKNVRTKIFSDEDIKLANEKMSFSSIHNAISYYLKTKKIIKIKRGLYCFDNDEMSQNLSKFYLGNILYSPSYISFESALSYYNLIPEAVYETASACFQKKTKYFETPLGNFSYAHIPVSPFFLETNKENNFIIAKPMRALFDLIYLRKKKYKNVSELISDLRLDHEELIKFIGEYTAKEIEDLACNYNKTTTKKLAQILIREYK